MSKTSTETVTEALRLIGVAAEDLDPTDAQIARGQAHMTDIMAVLNDVEGLAFEWTIEEVPDGAFLAFSRAVAGSVATTYGQAAINRAATAAAVLDPTKSLYELGMDGLRMYANIDFEDAGRVTQAIFY